MYIFNLTRYVNIVYIICIYVHVCVYLYVCVCVCVHVCMYTHMHMNNMLVCLHTCMYVLVCMHASMGPEVDLTNDAFYAPICITGTRFTPLLNLAKRGIAIDCGVCLSI